MVPSARRQARSYLCAARDLRAGLCCGVVPLQPRPDAAIHTWSIEGPNVRAARSGRGSRVCRKCNRVARQRACVRVGVSHVQMGSQAHVSYGFVTLNYWESPLSREFAEVIGNALPDA